MKIWRRFRLIGDREKVVLDLMEEHLGLVVKTVFYLKNAITMTMTDQNPLLCETKINLVSDYETLADDAHLKSMLEVCKGAFYAGLREDFLSLFEKVDDIADCAKDVAQILRRSIDRSIIELPSFQMLEKNEEISLTAFVDNIIKAVISLREAINNLENDVDKSIEKILEVKKWEREADDVKSALINRLYEHKNDLNLLTLLEMKELIFMLDNVADASEHSSEIVMAIIAKMRG